MEKDTIVIGSGKMQKAYAALQSEEVLGFNVIAFVCTSSPCEEVITDIPVLDSEEALWKIADVESTQFIVALEFEEHALRDWWLKNLAKHNCRSVSVIPTLRGVPLYGTDMSFIFSHEVMILRVGNNLAKRSSRLIKRVLILLAQLLSCWYCHPYYYFWHTKFHVMAARLFMVMSVLAIMG